MSDGKIRISTKILTDGAKKGFESLRRITASTAKTMKKDFDSNVKQLDKQALAVKNLKRQYDLLASGDVAPASLRAIESELKRAQKEATKLQEIMNQQEPAIDIQGEVVSRAKTKADTNPTKANIGYYEEAKKKLASLVAENVKVGQQFDALNQKCTDLPKKIAQIRLNPETSIEAQELADKIKLAQQSFTEVENRTVSLKDKLSKLFRLKLGSIFGGSGGGLRKSFEGIGSKVDRLKNRITKLAGAAFVFNILRQGLSSLATGMKALLSGNSDFANSLNQIKVNLLTAFTPIYNVVLPAINALMGALAKITGAIATFVGSIFGQTAKQAKDNASALYDQSQALDAVGSSAKNAEGALASFDNLEVNKPSETSSGGGGGAPLDFNKEIVWDEGFLNFLNKCKSVLATLFEPFKTAWESQGAAVIDSLKYAFESVMALVGDIGKTFMDVWSGDLGVSIANNLLGIWKEINSIIGNLATSIKKVWDENDRGKKLVESFLGSFDKILELVRKIAEKLKEFALSDEFQTGIALSMDILTKIFDIIGWITRAFSNAWDMHGLDILTNFQGILNEILRFADSILRTIQSWIMSEEFQSAISTVLDMIGTLFGWIQEIAQWVVDMYEKYVKPVVEEKIIPLINTLIKIIENIWTIAKPVIDFIVDALKVILEPAIAAVCWAFGAIVDVINFIAEVFNEVLEIIIGIFTDIEVTAQKCWDWIVGVFEGAATWFNNTLVQPVKDFFSGMWNGLKEGAHNAWEGIKGVFGTVTEFFKNIFTNAWEGVKRVFSIGGKIFDGIKDGIVNAFKTIVNAIIGGINKVVEVPFNGINWALRKLKGIDILGFRPFEWIGEIGVPQIPKLATGGIAYAPMVAQIGEYAGARSNPEIVTPENLMRQIVREESSSDKSVLIDNLTLVTKIGEETLQKQVIRGIRLEEQMIGRPLFVS